MTRASNGGLCAVAGAAIGAALTYVLMISGANPATPPPQLAGKSSLSNASGRVHVAAPVDLQPVLDRLDALQREVAQLQRGGGAATSPSERVAVAGGGARAIDVESVLAAFDEIERRKLEGMTTEHLIRSARQLRKSVEDRPQAIRRLEAALQREMTADRRAEVMMTLGVWHREMNTPHALAASARTFQSVIDRHGEVSEQGQDAVYQLIWTVSQQDNHQRGLELARAAKQNTGASAIYRMKARYAEAVMIEELGNKEQAFTIYRALLAEIQLDDPSMDSIARNIDQRMRSSTLRK